MILLNSSASITVKASGALKGLNIFRKGIATVPVFNNSDFAGTAVILGGDAVVQNYDTAVINCLICGFNQAVSGLRCSNALIKKTMIDCNNGILADTGGNPVIIKDCLGWPFLSVAFAPYNPAQLLRPGAFIKLQNNVDASKILTCTSYDYNKGVVLIDSNGVEISQSGFDAPEDVTAIGLEINGATGLTQVTNSQFVAQGKGIRFSPNSNSDVLLLTNVYFTANQNNDIEQTKGTLIIGGGSEFSSTAVANAIQVSDSAAKLMIDDVNCTKTSGVFIQNVSGTPFIQVGDNIQVPNGAAVYGGAATSRSVASGSGVDLPQGLIVLVTGTTTIFGLSGGWPGRVVTLRFSSSLTFSDSSVMNLSGNLTVSANDTLTLGFTASNQCYEISRSIN
jgi:hypothetical protein